MSDVIKVREEMLRALDNPNFAQCKEVMENWIVRLKRRAAIRRAPYRLNRRLSPEQKHAHERMRDKVRRLADEFPAMTFQEIANVSGLRNAGRVSEILNPKRAEGV
jgi:hypothetical protein